MLAAILCDFGGWLALLFVLVIWLGCACVVCLRLFVGLVICIGMVFVCMDCLVLCL